MAVPLETLADDDACYYIGGSRIVRETGSLASSGENDYYTFDIGSQVISYDTQMLLLWLEREVKCRLETLEYQVKQAFVKTGGVAADFSPTPAPPHLPHPPQTPAPQQQHSSNGTSNSNSSLQPPSQHLFLQQCASGASPSQAQGQNSTTIAGHSIPLPMPTAPPNIMQLEREGSAASSPGGRTSVLFQLESTEDTLGTGAPLDSESSPRSPIAVPESPTLRFADRQSRASRRATQSMRSSISQRESVERMRQEFVMNKSKGRAFCLDRIWRVMDDPDSSYAARCWENFVVCLIGVSVLTALQLTLPTPFWRGVSAFTWEITVELIFFCEILIRFIACPNRWMFFRNAYNLIDTFGAIPLILRLADNITLDGENLTRQNCDFSCSIIRGGVPILRLLKFLRRFQQFHLLLKAFVIAAEALPVIVFIYALIMMAFTATLYIVEPADNVESYMRAWWLAMMSMTTVGYGDMSPTTDAGRMVVSVFVFVSSMYMAIPVGIIGNAFNDVWKDRDYILLMQKTRERLFQAGYSAKDIPTLFNLFDKDRNGQLDIQEFKGMLKGMQLGLKKDRIVELYEAFDDDRSGGVDANEFLKTLFPTTFYELYGEAAAKENGADPALEDEDEEEEEATASVSPQTKLSQWLRGSRSRTRDGSIASRTTLASTTGPSTSTTHL